MQVAALRMRRYLSRVSRKGRIRNDYIRGSLGVADLRDKIRDHRLRWFGHVMRQDEEDLVRAIKGHREEGRRERGRLKVT